jgi:hypothetical protein
MLMTSNIQYWREHESVSLRLKGGHGALKMLSLLNGVIFWAGSSGKHRQGMPWAQAPCR